MGHVGTKTRSVGQIIKNPCENSRGHSFGPNIIKFAQNDHLDNISVMFKNGSCQVKTRSVGQIIVNLLNTLEATVLVQSSINLVKIEYGSSRVKN